MSVYAIKARPWFIHALGLGQLLSWGLLYYSFPLIAERMTLTTALSRAEVFGAATLGLRWPAASRPWCSRWPGSSRAPMTLSC